MSTFWGLMMLAFAAYVGLFLVSDGLGRIAKQMARKNALYEAELRSQKITFPEQTVK